MDAIDFHDKIASQFDTKYATSPAFKERFIVWTALLDTYVKNTDTVLDIGCGSGIFSNYVATKGCIVTGVDGSAEMIRLCIKRNTHTQATYKVDSLPFSNVATFDKKDIIIASSLLEYITQLDVLLIQLTGLLDPGGLLIVSMPNKRSFYRKLERVIFSLTGHPRYFRHIRNASTVADFNDYLYRLGFDVLETNYFSSHDPLSRWMKAVLPKVFVNSLFVSVYRKR